MRVARRISLLAAAGGLLVTASAVGSPDLAGAAEPAGIATVAVQGTLLVAQSDGPSGARTTYAVALADGDLVPVRGVPHDARPFSHFRGRLALPASVVSTLAERGSAVSAGTALDATSGTGQDALRLVDRRSLTLRVSGAATLSDPQPAATPTAHRAYVAALDNKGALGQDDTALLGHVSTVGSYWQGESNGAISSIGVPATVTHYDTALTTTDCGLGSDFWSVLQEAEDRFPGLDLGSGDQLVLFVPDACSSGGVVGEGTVGSSFASGGALIVKAGPAIEGTYGHETGHNYGFAHANARYAGSSMEYFGVYDVMGYAIGGFNQLTALSTPFRVFQGIVDADEIQDVDLGARNVPVHAAVTIKPRSDDAGLRSVRVVNPDTGTALYVDYRSGTGQDAGAFYADTTHGYLLNSSKGPMHYAPGVTINAVRGGSGVDTLVVDGSGHTSLGAGATWTNASGTLSVHVSALGATGADVSVDFAPPVISPAPAPAVTGTPRVGSPLKVSAGTWMSGVSLSYRWSVGGSPVPGATGTTYTPVLGDLGKAVRVAVTGTRAGYPDVTRTSADATVVGLGALSATRPVVSGRTKVGRTLTARPGTWTAGTSFTYAWFADGTRIRHATSKRLVLARAQRGKRIAVKVTGREPGYRTRTLTSARTARVV